jgi:hypothetical protein
MNLQVIKLLITYIALSRMLLHGMSSSLTLDKQTKTIPNFIGNVIANNPLFMDVITNSSLLEQPGHIFYDSSKENRITSNFDLQNNLDLSNVTDLDAIIDFQPYSLVIKQNMREKLFTATDLVGLSILQLSFLSTPKIQQGIREKLFAVTDLAGLNFSQLDYLSEPTIQQGMREKLFTATELAGLNNVQRSFIVKPEIQQCIREKLFTVTDLAGLNFSQLDYLSKPTIQQGMREKLFTATNLVGLNNQQLYSLSRPIIQQGMREKHFTVVDIASASHDLFLWYDQHSRPNREKPLGPIYYDTGLDRFRLRFDVPDLPAWNQVLCVICITFAMIFWIKQIRNSLTLTITGDITENAKKLADIDFSEESLTPQEQEVYEKYICPIGDSIMTNPVFDPRCPQQNFDEKNILAWLLIKQTHPMTRKPLIPSMLVLNKALKKEIDDFVAEQIESAELHNRSRHFGFD